MTSNFKLLSEKIQLYSYQNGDMKRYQKKHWKIITLCDIKYPLSPISDIGRNRSKNKYNLKNNNNIFHTTELDFIELSHTQGTIFKEI